MTTPDCRIPDADGTAFPYWIIIDPSRIAGRLYSCIPAAAAIASAIAGPFLSQAAAQAALDGAPHRYGPGSAVWCLSGHRSYDWRALCEEPAGMADRLAAAEAEVARLRAEAVEARAVEAAAVVAWLRADLPPAHLFDPYEKWDVALEFAANEIERGSHRAGAGGAR